MVISWGSFGGGSDFTDYLMRSPKGGGQGFATPDFIKDGYTVVELFFSTFFSGQTHLNLPLTPWLQPGVKRRKADASRF
jgi:hypothetical protein